MGYLMNMDTILTQKENDQVVYYKPDGSLDSPISVPYNGGDPSDPASTIMAAYGNAIILKKTWMDYSY
jgi:hypothetical protein